MRNYIQYHNTEKMGYMPADRMKQEFFILTKKYKPEAVGGKIWLISGIGQKPRRFFLSAVFIASDFSESPDKKFFYKIIGKVGNLFTNKIELTNLPWFLELKRDSGNFAFGFRELDNRYVKSLEALIRKQ